VPLADRHYNRQAVGAPQFVPPGACVVLLTERRSALWVMSMPLAAFVKHDWPGAWVNTTFRNEHRADRSSELIREALAATRWIAGDPPPLGVVTFIDTAQVRHKRDPGRCYRKAGFVEVGRTKAGLLALQLWPAAWPDADPPKGATLRLIA